MQLSQHSFSTVGVIATVVVISLLTLGLFGLTHMIERLIIPWYYFQQHSTRREQA